MAMPRRIKVEFSVVFEYGLFMVGEVDILKDFDKSTKDKPVQAIDEETRMPIWTVDVIDPDPQASKATRSLSVRIISRLQPVPTEAAGEGPFRPVAFEGLTALPYIDDNGNFSRIVWSYRSTGFAATTVGPAKPAQRTAA